jgi:short-subunit dehydrogenase
MARRSQYGPMLVALAACGVCALLVERRRRPSLRGKTALVTGGSRGLGLLIAEELASCGARIAIAARDEAELERARERLESRGAERVVTIPADLERPADVRRLVTVAREALGDIDILVNNAGTMEVGPEAEMTEASYESAMAVHFWAPLRLMQEVIPAMRAKHTGRIVNISSIGGMLSVPHLLPYCASKFALTALSEGMYAELSADGISVTTVCPGLMRTGSARHVLFRGQQEREHAIFSVLAGLPLFSMSAKRAARKIVTASLRGRPHLVLTWQARLAGRARGLAPGMVNRLFAWTNRILPSSPAVRRPATVGHAIFPKQLPSWISAMNDRAAARYNGL